MYKQMIVHRDIKLENWLYTTETEDESKSAARSAPTAASSRAFAPPKELPACKAAEARLLELERELGASALDEAQRAAVDEQFASIRNALDDAVRRADVRVLRAVLATEGRKHARAYSACHDIVKDDTGYDAMLSAARDALVGPPSCATGGQTC